MNEQDPDRLADELEREAAQLQEESEKLHGDLASVREDWEHKRSDPGVPGAVAPTHAEEDEAQEEQSPAPEAPPQDSRSDEPGPGDAETPREGAVGPPKEQLEE